MSKTLEPPLPTYLVNFENYLKPKKLNQCQSLQHFEKPKGRISYLTRSLKRLKLLRWYYSLSKSFGQLPLPRFLGFLRARKDDGLCKRKTGFEIYCEMASIHGFHIFVGAKTWQRILWWLLICTAVLLSFIIVIMSLSMSREAPTIHFIDTMMKPTSEVSFPAVTICGLNKISKERLLAKSREYLNSSIAEKLSHRNASWLRLLEDLSPSICEQVKSCQWENRLENCGEKLHPIWTPDQRLCCSFNYQQLRFYSSLGLSVVLSSDNRDFGSSSTASAGFEILIHESHEIPSGFTPKLHVPSRSEAHLMVRPFVNRLTESLDSIDLDKRACYLPKERSLFNFSVYSQGNCLAECRSEGIFRSCGCIPPNSPGRNGWTLCDLQQIQCTINYDNADRINEEQKICKCLPPCQFHRYEFQGDIRLLKEMTNNSIGDSSQISPNEVRLRIYYDTPIAEEQVLDIYENWLTFIGTFGGITGLFMGCSFVSVFELVFFTCVRPTCNWLTRQQILWRRRQKVAVIRTG
ncbi:pickpocket protein 11 [Drosophila serrata]|uniref:pickpocket protein 11 n=1 Tax=Drosophila serrata TaxID=7274 RepID=UPI000A1D16D8|nr:pickpocket protein 11 [Drosophila serrata]